MQPDRQQPPPSTTVLAHSCSPCASHSTAASAHVAAELSIQVRGAKVLCDGDALPSEGSLLQIEWQLWLRSQQRTTPNAAPAERCRASFDKPRREVHAGTTRRAPNIELQPRPSFQDKIRAGGRRGRRPPCGNNVWPGDVRVPQGPDVPMSGVLLAKYSIRGGSGDWIMQDISGASLVRRRLSTRSRTHTFFSFVYNIDYCRRVNKSLQRERAFCGTL